MKTEAEVRPAEAGDFAAIVRLLAECGLPTGDLRPASLASFFVVGEAEALSAVAGLELAGRHALLRSVAVAAGQRGRGLAAALLAACAAKARQEGWLALYLLANDAAAVAYFTLAGFLAVGRAQVPPALLALPEFSQLCPASTPCLYLPLAPEGRVAACAEAASLEDGPRLLR